MPKYTYKASPTSPGSYELFEDGSRISTGSLDSILGRFPNASLQGSVPETTNQTVFSDANVRENVIPDIQKRADKLTQTGKYVDSEGNLRNSDGSLIEDDPRTNEIDTLLDEADQIDTEIVDTLRSMRENTDATTARQIKSIQDMFAVRKQQQQNINMRLEAGVDTALLLGGSSRYAISSEGIAGAQERAGINELAQLDAEEQSLIAEVQAAGDAQNFEIMGEILERAEKKREEKVAKAKELAEKIAEANQKVQENQIKLSRDLAIVDLFKQGFTDPTDILDYLNRDESGVLIGDITLDEIQNVLDIVNPPPDMAGLSADYKTYKALIAGGDLKEGTSYIDYITMINNAKRAPSEDLGGGINISTQNRTKLLGAGFSAQDISDIEEGVNTYGIEAVLNQIDDPKQKQAVQEAYGYQSKVTMDQISTIVDREFLSGNIDPVAVLKNSYSDDELKELARENGFAGWWGLSDSELKKYLESSTGLQEAKELYKNILADQYRASNLFEE